jgi:ubiquinol-cytochrome c reductase iron-sulfur subunit
MLGVTLAICLGGFGVASVLWAHLLMEHKEAADPREELPSSEVEREAAEESLCAGASDIQRRRLLKFAVAGSIGLFAAMVISLLRSLVGPTDPALFGIVWKRGQRLMKVDGTPVSIHTLRDGDTTIVFPEGSVGDERAQTVLIRVKEQLLQLPEDRADWAPLGYIAYSRVCTHAGCPVGIFEPTTHLLLCPCHQSTFDVLKAATPTGGPAARPLPQLPLYAESDGTLRAGGSFSHLPGPGFWGMK